MVILMKTYQVNNFILQRTDNMSKFSVLEHSSLQYESENSTPNSNSCILYESCQAYSSSEIIKSKNASKCLASPKIRRVELIFSSFVAAHKHKVPSVL